MIVAPDGRNNQRPRHIVHIYNTKGNVNSAMILDVNERGHSIARVAVVNLHLRSGSKQVANDCLREQAMEPLPLKLRALPLSSVPLTEIETRTVFMILV
jgi:hypothetical protein